MSLIVSMIVAAVLAYGLREPLRRAPVPFYLAALAVAALAATGALSAASPVTARAAFPYLQQGIFAFALLSVVMFTSVLPEGRLRRALRPIRGELSIIACILIAGHVAHYANPMLTRVLSGNFGATAGAFWGTVLSLALVALLVVLTITSFRAVRSAMRPAVWKRVQRLAYLFYGLVFCHIFAMLAPSAAAAGERALVSVVLYGAILAAYVIGRLYRAFAERGSADSLQESPACDSAQAPSA